MAARFHDELCADGKIHRFWRQKQGRRALPKEIRAQRVNITLTPQARALGQRLARERGITFSELVSNLIHTEIV